MPAATTVDHYHLIDGDTHVNEPPDLWTTRVPAKYRDRAPRIERFEEGDAWILEGVDDPINFGLNASAGQPKHLRKRWVRFEDIRRGGWDPAARLEEMDEDGIDAAILYPTPRVGQAIFANTDVDFHLACIRAYNDWISEYAAHAPARFGGLGLLPNRGAGPALEEIARIWGRPGIRGFLLGCWPNGTLRPAPEDDKVWAVMSEASIPVNIHVSLSQTFPKEHTSPFPGIARSFDIPERLLQLIFGGTFDRFPDLQIVAAEVDCGWVPYIKEQLDNGWRRIGTGDITIAELPSTYFERQVHFVYITDSFGIDNRDRIGIERILWSSDYPHSASDWPRSWQTILATFAGVPNVERAAILAGNAQRLYGFGL